MSRPLRSVVPFGLIALAVAVIGIQAAVGQQPPTDPGVAAAQRLERLTGRNCFTTGKVLVALPEDLEQRASILGADSGWIVTDEVFKGPIEDLAASKVATIAATSEGKAWVDLTTPSGQIQGWALREVQSPKGTIVWLVVARTVGSACPSGE